MSDEILLVIDMQTGTLGPIIGKSTLLKNINLIIEFFHERNSPIIFVQQRGYGDISSRINKQTDDFIAKKSQPNAFSSSDFNRIIKTINYKSVVVVGVMSNGCVQHTCKGALANGYAVTLISDGHDSVIKPLRNIYTNRLSKRGAVTLTTQEYLASR